MVVIDNMVSPIFQLFFIEEMDMATNIPEASVNPMAPITQQAPAITIGSFILVASGILMASSTPEGIQLNSVISA
jgi:hypothetical protein